MHGEGCEGPIGPWCMTSCPQGAMFIGSFDVNYGHTLHSSLHRGAQKYLGPEVQGRIFAIGLNRRRRIEFLTFWM